MIHRTIDVIIPALNEEKAIGKVINDLPEGIFRHIIVANNGSTDRTSIVAQNHGAIVIDEHQKGYGAACLKALDYISSLSDHPDIVLFLDGDYSDYPQQSIDVLRPIIDEDYDFVIGSRVLGQADSGALTPVQKFGNWLSTLLIRLIYGYKFTDLGPFRAIKYNQLINLNMQDMNYGWTVEMQIKAAKNKLIITEVPVDYRCRVGTSKVSGTIKGSFLAGYKILWTIFKEVL